MADLRQYESAIWAEAIRDLEVVIVSLLPRALPGHSKEEAQDGLAGRRYNEKLEDYWTRTQAVINNEFGKLQHARAKLKEVTQ